MNIMKKIVGIALLATTIGYGGYQTGNILTKTELEKKIETAKFESKICKRENYNLHLELIKRGNPFSWELYGDSLGSFGYRRPDEGSLLLGTSGDGLIYLQED